MPTIDRSLSVCRYTILTRQARVPVGVHDLPEIPAGMLDGSGNFKGVAAEEMHEECDIDIQEEELVDLTHEAYKNTGKQGGFSGVVPSAGGSDEFVRLYMVRRKVDNEVIKELEGRLTGLLSEGEHIKLQIIKLAELWRVSPDGKALAALALMDNLERHHMMPKNRALSLTAKELTQDGSDDGFRLDGFSSSKSSQDSPHRTGRVSQAWSMMSSQDLPERASERDSSMRSSEAERSERMDGEPTSLADARPTKSKSQRSTTVGFGDGKGAPAAQPVRRRSVSFGTVGVDAATVKAAMKGLATALPSGSSSDEALQDEKPARWNSGNLAVGGAGALPHGSGSDEKPPRRMSVTFGGASLSDRDVSSSSPPGRPASGPTSPSPKSSMRRGSLQGRVQQTAVNHQHTSLPRPSSLEELGNLTLTLREEDQEPALPGPEQEPHQAAAGLAAKIKPAAQPGSVGAVVTHKDDQEMSDDDEADDLDADEDEVDRLMMEDLVEATWGATASPRSRDGEAVAKVKHVKEPPSYLAALYAKVDVYNSTQLVLMVLTIVALFGDDFRLLVLPKGADEWFSALIFLIFLIFLIEFIAQCLFKPDYKYSLFFWLDLLATASLVTDVIFLYEAIFGEHLSLHFINTMCVDASAHEGMAADGVLGDGAGETGQMARTGRAARVASRTARLIRIVRVLRVLRVFKLLKFFMAKEDEEEKEKENELRDSTTMMGAKLVEKISQRVITVVLVLFVGVVFVLQGFEPFDESAEVGLDWMQSMRDKVPPVCSFNAGDAGSCRVLPASPNPSDAGCTYNSGVNTCTGTATGVDAGKVCDLDAATDSTAVCPAGCESSPPVPACAWDGTGVPVISHMAANIYVASIDDVILCLKDLNSGGELFRLEPELIKERRDIEVLVHWAGDGAVMSATDMRGFIIAQSWCNLIIIWVLLLVSI